MSQVHLTRRAALLGLGAGALFPWLLRSREARADSTPRKRLVVWFTPCGVLEREFRPTGGEKDFTLGKILQPLAPHRDRMLIFGPNEPNAPDYSNMRKERGICIRYDGGVANASGAHDLYALLTGRDGLPMGEARVGAGPSVDQYVAQKIGAGDPFPSIQLGVDARLGTMCYAAANQPLPPENNPALAFASIFGNLGGEGAAEQRRKARRKEVLRLASAQAKSLAPRLSGQDRVRVEAQMSALANLDVRLDQTFVCQAPDLGSKNPKDFEQTSWDNFDRTPLIAEAQSQLLATALGCGLTHVASMQYGWAAANTRHPFVGANDYHHALSHDAFDWSKTAPDPEVEARYLDVSVWHMTQLAGFVDKLKQIPESDGSSVFDHTTILVVNELADGAWHSWQNMPFFLLGNAGGHFKTGRYLTFEKRYHTDLLLSVVNAMGINDTTFGEPSLCQGPLPGLT